MPVNRGRLPVYRQIADDLRAQIIDGTLPPGAQLPTEAELTDGYNVARATVRQALTILVNEGLVVARRPRGHFVRERQPLRYQPQTEFTPRPATPAMDAFMASLAAEGREASQAIEVAVVQPPPLVAERFDIYDDELVVVRKRVRYVDGEPYNINDSYFLFTMVQDTEVMRPSDIARGANEVLAEKGYRQERMLDEIFVRMPTPDEAQRLDLGPGTPVASHVCTGKTSDGTPVRVVVSVLPGDRHVIVYERERADARPADS
jgi:GntR family transcriptional regulator